MNTCMIPRNDRVLIQRIEEPSGILLTDAPKSIKGIVLAVGPKADTVQPGNRVLFNSKWNDFSAGENVGTGSDGSGPLERPLPLKADPMLHLVQEADIFAIVPDLDFRASIGKPTLEKEHFVNRQIAGPWSDA